MNRRFPTQKAPMFKSKNNRTSASLRALMPPCTGSLGITVINNTISLRGSCAELSLTAQILPIFWNHETLKRLEIRTSIEVRRLLSKEVDSPSQKYFKQISLGAKGEGKKLFRMSGSTEEPSTSMEFWQQHTRDPAPPSLLCLNGI